RRYGQQAQIRLFLHQEYLVLDRYFHPFQDGESHIAGHGGQVGQMISVEQAPSRMTLAERADGERWFAVQTKPRKERLALQHLENQGFETYCPLYRAIRRIGRRSMSVLEPMFASYVFVHLGPERQQWRAINGTIGVNRIVSFGPRPASLPPGFVARLQGLAGETGELGFDEELAAGDRVRIMGGPLDALYRTLLSSDARKRVSVLLELLSGTARVDIARSRLVRA